MNCDSLGFLTLEGQEPYAHRDLQMDLIHVTSSHPRETSLRGIQKFHDGFVATLERQQGRVVLLKSRQNMRGLPAPGKLGVVLGLQNPPQDEEVDFSTFWMRRVGIVFTTLAYNVQTPLAGGYYAPNIGLTGLGKEFVRSCARRGIAVDLSHSSVRTAFDLMQLVYTESLRLKVVVTHAGMSKLYNNARNLPDEMLKWVTCHDGFVGVPFFTFFLDAEDDGIDCYVRHIAHAINICGASRVCVGSDTPYVHLTLAEHKTHFAKLGRELDPSQVTMVGRTKIPELQHPHAYYSPRKMLLLREEFGLHFSPQVVDGICGRNFWDWCSRNLA